MDETKEAKPEYKEHVSYRPRRTRPKHSVIIQEDLGDRIVQTRMNWPIINTRVEKRTIPKKSQGKWKKCINVDRLRFSKSVETGRIMVYDRFTGEFLSELEEHDLMGLLKWLLVETGAIHAVKNKKCKEKNYYRIVLIGKVKKEILDSLGLSGT